MASEVYEELKSKNSIQGTLINPIFSSGLDKELLEEFRTIAGDSCQPQEKSFLDKIKDLFAA